MTSLIWFVALLFHQSNIGKVAATISCAEGFVDYTSTELCVSLTKGPEAQYSSMCQQGGEGTVFTRRMSDEMFKRFGKDLKKLADALPIDIFVGMKKGFGSSEWKFTNNKGSVKTKDYAFWAQDPGNYDCGVIRTGEHGVSPFGCKQSTIALCEKDEAPCLSKQMDYFEYYGRCLGLSTNKGEYDQVHLLCREGHILPIVDEESRDSAIAANYAYPAPVYAALQRQEDGRWMYADGKEETATERFAGGKPGNENCGVYGINKDGDTVIFTTKCDAQLRPLCELKRNDSMYL